MNSNRKIYTQGKVIFKPIPSLNLSYNFIYDNVKYKDWSRDYQFDPDGVATQYRTGLTNILKLTHLFSPTTFYTFGFSFFTKEYKRYLYEDEHDPRYVHPDVGIQEAFSFKTGGTDNSRFRRETQTLLGKFDITSQVTKTHQVKAGFEYRSLT